MTSFVLSFISVRESTWCVFLISSTISLTPCIDITNPPPTLLHGLHVHYTLYECSHRTMYGTVSSLLGSCSCRLHGSVILQLVGLSWSSAVFLKLGLAEPRRSAIGSRGFQTIKSRNGGESYCRSCICMCGLQFVWRHWALIITSLIARWQSIAAAVQTLPDSVVNSVSSTPQTVDVSWETIILKLAVDLLHVMYIGCKQMLVFSFIFDLLWTGRGWYSKICSLYCYMCPDTVQDTPVFQGQENCSSLQYLTFESLMHQ